MSEERVIISAPNPTVSVAAQGLQGAKGDTGAQGPQGLKGDTGTQGVQGIQGLKGDTGAQGAQGIQGSVGLPGTSLPQADYVSMLALLSNYTTMTLTKTSAQGDLDIRCNSASGDYVKYKITPNTRYQYVSQVEAYPGPLSVVYTQTSTRYLTENFTLIGSFLALTTTPYTTTTGNTWTTQVTTTSANAHVTVKTYSDNRGGLWNVDVAGNNAVISTWGATGVTKIHADVLTIPTAGTYTITGTFLGADPDHAPTGGVARGWMIPVFSGARDQIGITEIGLPTVMTLSPVSNKDFAIQIKPTSGGVYEFVPYHGQETEAFAEATKYYNSGALLNIDGMAVGDSIPLTAFEIVQHIYGRNTFSGATNLIEVWTTQRITPEGVFAVNGRWKVLTNILVNSAAYQMMLPGVLPLFNEAVSSMGTTKVLNGALAPLNVALPEDDAPDSWAYLSGTTDSVAAVRYNNRAETLRVGKGSKPPAGSIAFIELRTGGVLAKLYPRVYAADTALSPGTINRFSGAYFYGTIPGARASLSLS